MDIQSKILGWKIIPFIWTLCPVYLIQTKEKIFLGDDATPFSFVCFLVIIWKKTYLYLKCVYCVKKNSFLFIQCFAVLKNKCSLLKEPTQVIM